MPEGKRAISSLSNDVFKFKECFFHKRREGLADETCYHKAAPKIKNTIRPTQYISSATMTGHSLHDVVPNGTQDSSLSKYFKAVNNKHGVRHDLEVLCKFVRETLFYALIHDARGSGANPNDEIMGENGKACHIFVHVFLRDKDKITNTELLESSRDEKEHYLKFLWREGLQTKGKYNIRKALSNEKSAVYAGISESFKSKFTGEAKILSTCYLKSQLLFFRYHFQQRISS
jgi:hypothetical protein